jgi:hypothetical protein
VCPTMCPTTCPTTTSCIATTCKPVCPVCPIPPHHFEPYHTPWSKDDKAGMPAMSGAVGGGAGGYYL